MVTEKELNSLERFGRISKGHYSDYCKYDIICENGVWSLWEFSEVDGELIEKIVDIESIEHFKEIYEFIEGETL